MKKGQGMSVQTVVMIVLGLIVLVILVMVVRQQVTGGAKKYTEIGKEATIKADKCGSFILGRSCSDSPCDTSKGFEQVYSPSGKWTDKDCNYCCQKA